MRTLIAAITIAAALAPALIWTLSSSPAAETQAIPPARTPLPPSPRPPRAEAAPAHQPTPNPSSAHTLAAIEFARALTARDPAADLNSDGRIDARDAVAFHARLSDLH